MNKVDVVQIYLKRVYEMDVESEYIYNSNDAGSLFTKVIGDRDVETVSLLCLDNTYKLINFSTVSIGNIDSVNSGTAEIFKTALLCNSSKIFIGHNHPSGIAKVTKKDILVTKNIGSVARLLGIVLVDSIVISSQSHFVSIRNLNEEGKLNG